MNKDGYEDLIIMKCYDSKEEKAHEQGIRRINDIKKGYRPDEVLIKNI